MLKKMNRMVLIMVVVALVAAQGMTFADVSKPVDRLDLKFETASMTIEEKNAEALAKREAYRAKMTEIITLYTPSLLGNFESFWSEHDAIHVALIAEHTRIRTARQAETKSVFDEVKAMVLAGDMTREEAKATLLAYKAELQADKEITRADIDALKADLDVSIDERKALNTALKTAVEAKDAGAVETALMNILAAQPRHLTFDQAKLDYFMAK